MGHHNEFDEEKYLLYFDPKPMGARLREVRKRQKGPCGKCMTVYNLSLISGLLPSYISQIEGGFRTPRLSYLLQIMKTIKAEPNYIFQDYYDFAAGQEIDKELVGVKKTIINDLNYFNEEKLELVYELILSLKKYM